ncbi:geranylgeranyl reductase family protein [Kitasatospora atroaurantiaca]|uniref:Geranylgeranyl reductase family protein n=1 Tax=Kitasatospora atroaurantiaca TaxID=285545 RepID=A0A561EJY7_9ACTN|nr:geranylgeranyl reductase family protein [Kitasatospora atroaurantiaca]
MTETAASEAEVTGPCESSADVIVVGAGPAGSTTAYHLARTGLDVLLLEKAAFPREKVCGDGLTPRAVKQLVDMGIDVSESAGWLHNKGLRIVSGGSGLELDWPELAAFPDFGAVRRRADFDELLVRQGQSVGVRLFEQANVSGPVLDSRTGRITGVTARLGDEKRPVTFTAPLVVAADGNSTRLSLSMGRHRRQDRPMGVAYRTYFTSPRHDDRYLEAWMDLSDHRDGKRRLLSGYGWVFGMGDGTSNVGLGVLDTSTAGGELDWRELLRTWCAGMPAEYGFTPANMTMPIRGAALPMALNRQPHYADGLLLVGDAAGMVSPSTGEGIAYAMESGRIAADVIVQALARITPAGRERALQSYPRILRDSYGGHFTLGRSFVRVMGNQRVLKLGADHGLAHPTLMKFVFKLMVNLSEPRAGDAADRIINALTRLAPRS